VIEDPTETPDGAVAHDPASAPPEAETTAAVVELHSRPPVPEAVTAPGPAEEPNTTAPQPDDVPATDVLTAPDDALVDDTVEDSLDDTADADPVPADAPGPGRRPRRRDRRGPNLREQRRQRTREAIVDAAAELFVERGFDAVSVSEIAQRAGVVEKTVFNHFPVKEGLVFEADPPMRAALLDAVRRRPAGESVAAAAGGFVVAAVSQLGAPAAAEGMAEMARVIRGSRTLQGREREILGALTDSLAEQITLETRATPGELEPWLAANAVLGLYSSLLELARDRVLAGASGPELVSELRTRGRRGLALLQFGLAGYAKRR
jgi:AcrR family transcriptional regulator